MESPREKPVLSRSGTLPSFLGVGAKQGAEQPREVDLPVSAGLARGYLKACEADGYKLNPKQWTRRSKLRSWEPWRDADLGQHPNWQSTSYLRYALVGRTGLGRPCLHHW
jgi:hypothetical protein